MIQFTKMHGLCNDYLFFDAFQDYSLAERSDWAQRSHELCDRRAGAGADGVILLEPPRNGRDCDAIMRIWNADGSDGVICGNGLRCAAKLLYECNHVDTPAMRIQTGAGVRTATCTLDDGARVRTIRVGMDRPVTDLPELNLRHDRLGKQVRRLERGSAVFEINGWQCVCINVGNPHCVLPVQSDLDAIDLASIGPFLEHHEAFPERTNVHLMSVQDRSHISVCTWERGSGITHACATGACASVIASTLLRLTERDVCVSLVGGELHVRWDEETDELTQEGPAETVFEGIWHPQAALATLLKQ